MNWAQPWLATKWKVRWITEKEEKQMGSFKNYLVIFEKANKGETLLEIVPPLQWAIAEEADRCGVKCWGDKISW